jgi:hypothetical protein
MARAIVVQTPRNLVSPLSIGCCGKVRALLGVKRTWRGRGALSNYDENDPSRKWSVHRSSRGWSRPPSVYPLTNPFWFDILQSGPWSAVTKCIPIY